MPTLCIRSHIPLQKSYEGDNDPYYNRKSFQSLVLMAIVDAKKRFLWASCTSPGSFHDSRILSSSNFGQWVDLEGHNFWQKGSEFIVGDSAFALKWWCMKAPDNRTQDYASHILPVKGVLCSIINSMRCLFPMRHS